MAEVQLRGNKPPVSENMSKQREPSAVSLTPGKLSAVHAAFKAGMTPSKIAKHFGIRQSEVRKALAK
jgi:hypothetical protein